MVPLKFGTTKKTFKKTAQISAKPCITKELLSKIQQKKNCSEAIIWMMMKTETYTHKKYANEINKVKAKANKN